MINYDYVIVCDIGYLIEGFTKTWGTAIELGYIMTTLMIWLNYG
jgi:hypothetical protein